MAFLLDFKKNVEGSRHGVVFKNSYWRISDNDGLVGGKTEFTVKVEIKESKESSGSIGLFVFSFIPDVYGTNYHEQAYEFLKLLPMFKNAIDV